MSYESQFRRLRAYNVFMGFLHLAQAVVIIILSNDFIPDLYIGDG